MIDWDKVGPGNSPTPKTPTTTVPVVSQPSGTGIGDAFSSVPSIGGTQKPYEWGTGFHVATQEQIDQMDPGQRMARGIDNLGNALFGRDNGSLLGGVPLLGDIIGAGGNAIHGIGDNLVVKPIEGVAHLASRVPLGWLPGGADENFNAIGEWAKNNNPAVYEQWQLVNAAANADFFGGGNLKADFNMEIAHMTDDASKDSWLGTTPEIATGRTTVGSLGGAFSHAVTGFLGLLGNTSQRLLGGAGFFDPGTSSATYEQQKDRFAQGGVEAGGVGDEAAKAFQMLEAGEITEEQARAIVEKASKGGRNRVQEAADRMDLGLEVSEPEEQAVNAWRSGEWSLDHAQDFLVQRGQGATRNFVGQIGASLVTDPLLYASVGAGAVAKAGIKGAQAGEAALGAGYRSMSVAEKVGFAAQQEGVYMKLAATVTALQQSQMGPIFRISRGLVDPFAVYKPSTVQRATNDMLDAVSLTAFERAYGHFTVRDIRGVAREVGLTREVDSAIASYVKDQSRLMVARKLQRDMIHEELGEEVLGTNVDDIVDPVLANAPRDAETQLVDHFLTTAKNSFTPEDEVVLANRLGSTLGKDVTYWQKRIPTMSHDMKSALHAITYKRAEVEYHQALAMVDRAAYGGNLPLRNMVLMTTDTLDETIAQQVVARIRSILKGEEDDPKKIAAATAYWNSQAAHYPKLASVGYATGGKEQVEILVKELERLLQKGSITKVVDEEEIADPVLRPVRDMLDRHSISVPGSEPKRLWKLGFRPDEDVAWGLDRNPDTGLLQVDTDPTISHVVDAVPGRQPFSDTTRNVLGQIIGVSKAERLNRPIDSVEAYANTMRDVITGRRLVLNMEKRFERSMLDAGVPKPIIKDIFGKARDVAALDFTTVRGIKPANLWEEIHDFIPRDLVLKDGSTLNIHVVMDHLLEAAEGDLRIMGVASNLSQRMRNRLRQLGDGSNIAGQITVTLYNKMRYAFNPTFVIQRIGDAPYYSILYGITPVGKKVAGQNAELRVIEENLGRSAFARDFSMDMTEYATRSNFTEGIKSQMQQMGLVGHKFDKIIRTPDAIISANMTNMLHARLGDIVRGSLDNLVAAAEKDPSLKAEMLAAADDLSASFEDWRRVYSESAGYVLDDNEVGLRYIQDVLQAWRRHVVNPDGTLDYTALIREGERFSPNDIGGIESLHPEDLARELGYEDAVSLRKDITGSSVRINGEYVHLRGEHDLAWLEEQLRHTLHAHDNYTKRALAYFGGTWDGFWRGLAQPIEDGGLDISQHFAAEAQNLIAILARDRGMDPWEYLSSVMSVNLGVSDLSTAMGRFASFLKRGPMEGTPEEWGTFFRSHLDPSGQQTLMDEWGRMTSTTRKPIEFAKFGETVPPSAPGKPPRPPVAKLPDVFQHEEGYVYRVETPEAMQSGLPRGAGVTTGAPTPFYAGKDGVEKAIFRIKDDGTLAVGRHGPGGTDRLTTSDTSVKDIEVLAPDGSWQPVPEDPVKDFFNDGIIDMLKHRVRTGPNPNADVEAVLQQISKMVQATLKGAPEAGLTRTQLRRLVREAGGKTGPLPEDAAAAVGAAPTPAAAAPTPEAPKTYTMEQFPLDVDGTPYRVHTRETETGFKYDISIRSGTSETGAPRFKNITSSGRTFDTAQEAEDAGAVFSRTLAAKQADDAAAAATAKADAEAAAAAAAPAPEEVVPHNYNVTVRPARQGQTGYVYEVNGTSSTETFPTRDAAEEAGEVHAQKVADKVRADLAAPMESVDERLDRLQHNMDLAAKEAARGEPSIGAAKVDSFYDRKTKNYISRLLDEEGNQVGDAITTGTKADRDAAVRQLDDALSADQAQARLEADASAAASKYAEARSQAEFDQYAASKGAEPPRQDGGEIISEAETRATEFRDGVLDKWKDRPKNRLQMEKELRKLEEEGFDTSEADDLLNDYDNIERSDFTADEYGSRDDATEAYQEARQEKWDEMMESIEGAEYTTPGHVQEQADNADMLYEEYEAAQRSATEAVSPTVEQAAPVEQAPAVDPKAEYVGLRRVIVPDGEGGESVRYYSESSHRWFSPEEAAAERASIPEPKMTASEAPELASPEAYYAAGNLNLKNRDASVKAFDALPDDAEVWVFHATDSETADRLAAEGIDMGNTPENLGRVRYSAGEDAEFAPGAGVGQGMYVGGTAYGVEGYGREMIAIRVPKRSLQIAPENEGSALSLGDALINHDGGLLTEGVGPENIIRIPRTGKVPGDSYDEITQAIGGGEPPTQPPTAESAMPDPDDDLGPNPSMAEDILAAADLPKNIAVPFNRSQALIISLLKDKIEDAQQDIFRLAEMQTQRTVLERSLNHPLFALYPASYMWGKVLPETVKFLAKNPYAATYTIANVQRSIAIQREFDEDLDSKVGSVDRSAGAFLLDYLTPGLPWSDHSARFSPLVRGIFEGKDVGEIWQAELSTISPQRWVSQVVDTMNEIPGAIDTITQPPYNPEPMSGLESLGVPSTGAVGNPAEQQITGPTKGSALAPLLMQDLERLQSILLQGESAEEE